MAATKGRKSRGYDTKAVGAEVSVEFYELITDTANRVGCTKHALVEDALERYFLEELLEMPEYARATQIKGLKRKTPVRKQKRKPEEE